MLGPLINSAAVVVGGTTGGWFGRKLPERVRTAMPLAFGLVSLGVGCALVAKVQALPALALGFLIGTFIGESLELERRLGAVVTRLQGIVSRSQADDPRAADHVNQFITVLVLYCASGMGIFGSMNEGMTGDHSVLFAKAILDLFSAIIFAAQLGIAVAFIALPMLVVQVSLMLLASLVVPLTTPAMLADFTAMGGLLMIATGLRLSNIRMFGIVNMLPALLLAMPCSALWAMLW